MGCSSSSKMVDDSDVVLQCLKRKRLMGNVVNYRYDFAFAHMIYVETLRKVGNALSQFAEADSSKVHTPPRSPIVSSRHISSSAGAAISPLLATFVHPPHSPSPASNSKTANRPSVIPPASTTPTEGSRPTLLSSEKGATFSTTNNIHPYEDADMTASSPKDADFSAHYYSPAIEESDDIFMPFASSDPPVSSQHAPPFTSSPQRSSWDPFNFFHSSPFTYHSREERRMSEDHEVEEEMIDFDKIVQEEGLPELEEEEQEYETEQPVQNEEQYHEEVGINEHSEGKQQEQVELSTQNSVEKVDEKQEVNIGVIVPFEKKDEGAFTMAKGKNLTEVVKLIEDQFAKVVDSVKELSGMLETYPIHRHASNVDFRVSSKVLNAVTWHRPRKTAAHLIDMNDINHGADFGMAGSHASTLEMIYAWEKKLYEEVEARELLRIAFDKKSKQLDILDSKGEDPILVEKTKFAVRSLDSQLMVALRAVYSASMRIQQLTYDELYPQLAELLGGLMNMWKVMLECHKTQRAIVQALQSLESPKARVEASDAHRHATIELEHEIEKWQDHIHLWASCQKKYINALLGWLELCHTPPGKDGSDGAMSASRTMGEPSIYSLIKHWNGSLTRFEEHTKVVHALRKFGGILRDMQIDHSELLIPKKRVEAFTKRADRKTGSRLTMRKRYGEAVYSGKRNRTENQASSKDSHQERESFLKSSKSHQEEDKTEGEQPRGTLSCLQENLPDIFDALISFAEVALREYEKLHQETMSLKYRPEEQASEE